MSFGFIESNFSIFTTPTLYFTIPEEGRLEIGLWPLYAVASTVLCIQGASTCARMINHSRETPPKKASGRHLALARMAAPLKRLGK